MSARKLPQSDGVFKGVEYSHTEINRRFLKEGQGCHRKSQEWEPIRRITVSAAAFQMPTVSFILPLQNSTSVVEWNEQLRVFQHQRANIWSGSVISLFLKYNTF